MTADKTPAERLKSLREAVAAEPSSGEAHLKLGSALVKMGLQKEAERELLRATELNPGLAEAWVNIGGILFTRWNFKGCVEANQKAIALSPDLLMGHYNLGLGHLYLGQAEEMAGCFRRVIELDPSNAGGHYHLAVALNALGKVEEAVVSMETSRELGYSPDPKLIKAIDKALNPAPEPPGHPINPLGGEGVLTMEIGKNPDEDDQDEPKE